MKSYYVYILSSFNKVLYVGMTNDLARRIYEHKNELVDGFSKKYKCKKLVFFEECSDVLSTINREKQFKGWNRKKKIALIESVNPLWKDLSTNPAMSETDSK